MDADSSWSARLSSASKKYQSALQSRSDIIMGFEDDDLREEFPCPFCSEYFDIAGLCCHIYEEHPMDTKNGVCPVCAMRIGVDMVAHITLQHRNVFKMQCKRKSRKSGSHSTLSILRKELRQVHLQSLFGGSSFAVSSSNSAPDPLLSSFILPIADESVNIQSQPSPDKKLDYRASNGSDRKWNVQSSALSAKDQKEKANRSEFVQGLLLSLIFDDNS